MITVKITGPTGSGKTTLANIIIQALLHGVHHESVTPELRAKVRAEGVEIYEGEGKYIMQPESSGYHTGGFVGPFPAPATVSPQVAANIFDDRLKVMVNPIAPGKPFIRFIPDQGWNVSHGDIKSCWGIGNGGITDAVNDYNKGVERAIARLRINGAPSPLLMELDACDGWQSAIEADKKDTAKKAREKRLLEKHNADMPPLVDIKATPTKLPASLLEFQARGRAIPILELLALAAMVGEMDISEPEPVLEGPPSDAMRRVLEESTILHVCSHGNAVLAVPRELGEEWCRQLVEYIKADAVSAVRGMLTTAGLMK